MAAPNSASFLVAARVRFLFPLGLMTPTDSLPSENPTQPNSDPAAFDDRQ